MAEVKALAEKYFGPIPARTLPPRQRLREPPSFAAREVTLKDPEVQQATWQRIYLTPPERENLQKAAALDLLSEILGGGPTSRLYRHLVVEQGLAVAVEAGDDSEAIDYGQFIIAAAPPAGVDTVKLEAGIDGEIALLLDKGIEPGELAAAKNRIAADAIKARDSLRGPAQLVGTALITGTTLDQVEAWPERIASVSAAEVLQAAKDVLLHKENSVTGALLPGEGVAPGPRPAAPSAIAGRRHPMSRHRLARWLLAACLAGLGLLLAGGAASAAVERVVSPGGIEAWLIEDHTNPLISLAIGFRGGSAQDPAGKEGMAFLAAGLLDEGAGGLDSATFQAKLSDLAIDFNFDSDADSIIGSMRMLTAHRDEAFELLHLALTKPRIDAEPLMRVRNQVLSIIASEASSPDEVAGKAWFRMMLADHPYGRPAKGTAKSLAAITGTDLRKFAARQFTRERMLIAVVGDIGPADLARLLDRSFGDLPAHGAAPALSRGAAARARRHRGDGPRSGSKRRAVRRSGDQAQRSRLLRRGLAGRHCRRRRFQLTADARICASSAGWSTASKRVLVTLDHAALLSGSFSTKNASAREAIELTRAEWKRMGEAGPSEAELADAKTHLIGSYPLRFDSTQKAANVLLGIQLAGLPIDYVDKRAGYIQAVSLADAKRVARRLYHADDLRFLVLGRPVAVTGTLPVPPAP